MLKKGIILLLLLLVFSCSGVQNIPPSVKTETRQTSAQPTQVESKSSSDEEKTVLVKTVGNTPTYAEQTEDGMYYYFKYISDESRFQNEAEEKAYIKALGGVSDIVCGVKVEKEGIVEKEAVGRKSGIIDPRIIERETVVTKTRGVLQKNLSPLYVSQNYRRTIKYGLVENFWVSTVYMKIKKTDFENMSSECKSDDKSKSMEEESYISEEIRESCQKEWAKTLLDSDIKDREKGLVYGIGASTPLRDEDMSYKKAFKNAVNDAAQKMRMTIDVTEEEITSVLSKKSEIIDPTIKISGKNISVVRASIGNINVKDTCREIYEAATRDGRKASLSKFYVAIEVKNETLEKKIEELVDKLARDLSNAPIEITIGNFKYKETGCSGVFIEYFKELFESKISGNKSFKVKGRINFKDASSGLNLETNQAKNLKSNILHGKYMDGGNNVTITAYITNESGHLSSSSINIEKEKIKEIVANGCEENTKIISAIEPLPKPDFDLLLWTDKGNGGTYKKGDTIEINIQSSERCHVKMFNIDEKGVVTVIEDTKAEKILKNQKRNFKVKAMRPGVETIIAIASQSRFPEDSAINENLSGDVFSEIYKNLRNVKGKKAEYKTTLTVLE